MKKIENERIFWEKVNHDIRTPLNGISGLLYLMRQNLHDPNKMEEYLDKIEASAEELKYQLALLLNLEGIMEPGLYEDKVEAAVMAEDVLHGKNILIVEDNEINRVIVREILESWGCTTLQAVDGLEATKIFEDSGNGEKDFILMDIRMPYMNGYEAAKRIRGMSREDAGKVVIIALTANTYQAEIEKVKEAGMDGIITKPLHVSALRHLMMSKAVNDRK